MKSTLDSLTENDKEALAHFKSTEAFRALTKLLRRECEGLAADAIQSKNIEDVRELNGQRMMAEKIPKMIQSLKSED